MKIKLLILIGITLWVGARLSPAYAGRDFFEPSFEKTCDKPIKVINSYEIDPEIKNRIESKNLDQKNFGTCFGFSGYYLLSYYEALMSGADLALPDVLATGCKKKFEDDGGQTAQFLFNLLHKEVATETSYPYDYEGLYSNVKKIKPEQCRQTEEAIYSSFKSTLELNDAILKYCDDVGRGRNQKVDPKSKKYTYEVLNEMPGIEKIRLTPYQVQYQEAESVDQALDYVRDQFEMPDTALPMSLAFCTEEDDEGKCQGRHAVTVTGVRKICCGNRCQEEWNIANSYGTDYEKHGWHRAIPLAEGSLLGKLGFTQISPCQVKSGDRLDRSGRPVCKSYIQGKYPVQYAIDSGNLGALRAVIQEKGKEIIHKRDSRGRLPLDAAVIFGYPKIAKMLLENGAKFEEDPRSHLTPMDRAVLKETPDMTYALIDAYVQDQYLAISEFYDPILRKRKMIREFEKEQKKLKAQISQLDQEINQLKERGDTRQMIQKNEERKRLKVQLDQMKADHQKEELLADHKSKTDPKGQSVTEITKKWKSLVALAKNPEVKKTLNLKMKAELRTKELYGSLSHDQADLKFKIYEKKPPLVVQRHGVSPGRDEVIEKDLSPEEAKKAKAELKQIIALKEKAMMLPVARSVDEIESKWGDTPKSDLLSYALYFDNRPLIRSILVKYGKDISLNTYLNSNFRTLIDGLGEHKTKDQEWSIKESKVSDYLKSVDDPELNTLFKMK